MYSESESSSEDYWIKSWISEPKNYFLVRVPQSFILDEFNLFGLSRYVFHCEEALSALLDEEDEDSESDLQLIDLEAQKLYGYIHQRFLTTSAGLREVKYKYKKKQFGVCPRLSCCDQPLLPCGLSESFGKGTVHVFCPRCENVYFVLNREKGVIDGANFGPAFPHLFLMTYPEYRPDTSEKNETGFEPIVQSLHLLKTTYIQQIRAQQIREGVLRETFLNSDETAHVTPFPSPASSTSPFGYHTTDSGKIDFGESESSSESFSTSFSSSFPDH